MYLFRYQAIFFLSFNYSKYSSWNTDHPGISNVSLADGHVMGNLSKTKTPTLFLHCVELE